MNTQIQYENNVYYEYQLFLLLQDNADDGELKQQKPAVESGEERGNTDYTFKDSSSLLLEEVELRDALTRIMRQGSLLTTHYIFKEEPLYKEHTNILHGRQVPV
jgi:hypothetical protein